MPSRLVSVLRGSVVETIHRGEIALVDSYGKLLLQAGSPERKVAFWRSGAKPLQALPLVASGAADALGLDEADLAVACASHNGEEAHVRQVAHLLERAGLAAEALICAATPPWDAEAAAALAAQGQAPTSLHHRCSGKHTAMLALAGHLGADPARYARLDQPVQRLIREHLAALADLAPSEVVAAPDGCGVPTFAMTVARMALAFARLADPAAIPPGRDGAGQARQVAARRVAAAMVAQPNLVAGRRRLCSELMQLAGDRLIVKSGSAGLYCAGLFPAAVAQSDRLGALATPGAGVGLVLKLEDGHEVYPQPVLVEVLAQLGLLRPAECATLANYHRPVVHSGGGSLAEGGVRLSVRLRPPG